MGENEEKGMKKHVAAGVACLAYGLENEGDKTSFYFNEEGGDSEQYHFDGTISNDGSDITMRRPSGISFNLKGNVNYYYPDGSIKLEIQNGGRFEGQDYGSNDRFEGEVDGSRVKVRNKSTNVEIEFKDFR